MDSAAVVISPGYFTWILLCTSFPIFCHTHENTPQTIVTCCKIVHEKNASRSVVLIILILEKDIFLISGIQAAFVGRKLGYNVGLAALQRF